LGTTLAGKGNKVGRGAKKGRDGVGGEVFLCPNEKAPLSQEKKKDFVEETMQPYRIKKKK